MITAHPEGPFLNGTNFTGKAEALPKSVRFIPSPNGSDLEPIKKE